MIAIMKVANGLHFTGIVVETLEAAEQFMKSTNPWAYRLQSVNFVSEKSVFQEMARYQDYR